MVKPCERLRRAGQQLYLVKRDAVAPFLDDDAIAIEENCLLGMGKVAAGNLAARDLNNFQPRVGLAWQITPKLVFRSSFGLIHQDLMTNGLNQNFEEYFATASLQAPVGDPRPIFQIDGETYDENVGSTLFT